MPVKITGASGSSGSPRMKLAMRAPLSYSVQPSSSQLVSTANVVRLVTGSIERSSFCCTISRSAVGRGVALGDVHAAEARVAVLVGLGHAADVVLDGGDRRVEEDRHAVLHLLADQVVGLAVDGGARGGVAGGLGLFEQCAQPRRLVAAGVGRALGEEVVAELLVG